MDSVYILFFISATLIVVVSTYTYKYLKKPRKDNNLNSLYMESSKCKVLLSDKRKAISLLSAIVKNDSEHINAYLQLGNLLRNEDPEKAIKIHQMLTVRQNLNKNTKIEILKALSLDYEKIADISKSKIEAERVLNLDKNNLWANSFLLSLAEKNKDWDYAEKKAKEFIKN